MDQTLEKIKDLYSVIPEKLKQFIADQSWIQKVNDISKKYSLDEDQLKNLEIETLLVLVGIKYINDFTKNIEEQLIVNTDTSEKISSDIGDALFVDILDLINQANQDIDKAIYTSSKIIEQQSKSDSVPANLPTMPEEDYLAEYSQALPWFLLSEC